MQRTKIGDIALHVVDRGRGPAIVLVHGFPLDHSMWQPQIESLASSYRVIAPDLRGFGKSDVTPGTVTMQQFADDIAALLDALGVDEPVAFCGLSMGGYVGWQFFQRHRERLARLIQCDTRAIADTDEGRRGRFKAAETVLEHGPAPLVETMIPRLFAEEFLAAGRQQNDESAAVRATRRVMMNANAEGIAAALRGLAERPDVSGMLGQIDVPTLVLCGEHDAISPPQEMRGIAEAIPAARFVQIDGAGHMSPLEKPDEVREAIEAFLQS